MFTAHDGGADGPVAIAGPTCDSTDVLYERTEYRLPLALAEGDQVTFLSTGAYTTSYSSVGFNGFAPLGAHYLPVDPADDPVPGDALDTALEAGLVVVGGAGEGVDGAVPVEA